MFSMAAPAPSTGLPAAGVLWFDSTTAFMILSLALLCSALVLLCAGLLARRERRPAGYLPPLPPRPGRPALGEQPGRLVPARAG
jgi:hypothetical protein